MKSVLISIQPKWCELIASGRKTIEVRKTRPKLETPFKCYIYCTKGRDMLWVTDEHHRDIGIACLANAKAVGGANKANGKVIGEFVCDRIEQIPCYLDAGKYEEYLVEEEFLKSCQLTYDELFNYLKGKDGYGWHIFDLKIYENPKELGEFRKPCDRFLDCIVCRRHIRDKYGSCDNKLIRPPQSYCYLEEL